MTAEDCIRPDFELTALRDYLRRSFGAGVGGLKIDRVDGGQSNPTYFLTFGRYRTVLRKKPAGPILPGAHAIEREFRVLKALSQTDVPVPKAILLCEDSSVLGTPFYLMERLEGRTFHNCSLPAMAPTDRRSIYQSLAETMSRLHAVNPYKIGLEDFGRPGNYFERQISRWSKQYAESPSDRISALDEIAARLPVNVPPDDGRISIAHGDFRLGNMLFHPKKHEVVGILDWELATLGHPLADLAFCCIPWHSRPDEYGGILGLNHAALGIPSEAEFVEHYFMSALPTLPMQCFHIVFALFRFSVIFLGISDRAKSGTASSRNAAEVGLLAAKFAERARQAIVF